LLYKQVARKTVTETLTRPLCKYHLFSVVQGPAEKASNDSQQHSSNLNQQATSPKDMGNLFASVARKEENHHNMQNETQVLQLFYRKKNS